MISMLSRLFKPCSATASILFARMASTGGKLAGKVAIVTASTDGIGLAIAERLARDGAKVMVSSRKQNHVDAAVKKFTDENLTVAGITCHVAKPEDRTKLIDETLRIFGSVDILVSNAAVNPIVGPMLETTPEAWDKIFDVNVKSTFFLCKEVAAHMTKEGSGSIVLVSSIAGYVPFSLLGAYCVSKTALIGMGKALAPELATNNIRINVVCPGIIQTKFSKALWDSEAALEQVLDGIPMKRIGTPHDVSGLVSFLASEDSAYITGESMLATGGMTARL